MNYGTIKKNDIANGVGVRVSLFVSGCTHHCPGCFGFGKPFTGETEEEILDALAPDYIEGLTLLGGEPFEPENQKALVPFLEKVRERYPQKNLWCYTGYTLEQDLLRDSRARCGYTDRMLSMIDVLVDGRFVEALKDISLPFRGSSNQRILNLRATLESGSAKLLEMGSGRI